MIPRMKVDVREDGKKGRKRNVKSVRRNIPMRKESKRSATSGILVIQMTRRDTKKIKRGGDMIRIEYTCSDWVF
jgi:hypothetical protein